MIKIESVHIEEMRGVRKLDLTPNQSNFSISGPNGSGKSGVIDAIEFGLTGEIKRLTGRGTKGLSVADHGPHVDKVKFPDAAFVTLTLFVPELDKSVTVTRHVKSPRSPIVEPSEADLTAIVSEVAEHPEIALSRRDIIRFILVEPTRRSEEIQSLLKLDRLGQVRSALNTAHNRLQTARKNATATVGSQRESLRLHLQTPDLAPQNILEVTNKRRRVLGLSELPALDDTTSLDAGVTAASGTPTFNKDSALRDIGALETALQGLSSVGEVEAEAIRAGIKNLERDPQLLAALQHRELVEKGLELLDGPECPLCDTTWDDEARLREHLREKLAKSEEAQALKQSLLDNGAAFTREIGRLASLIAPPNRLASEENEESLSRLLSSWSQELDKLKATLDSVDGILSQRDRFESGWLPAPTGLGESLKAFKRAVQEKPDQSATVAAQTFLTTAQIRLDDLRKAQQKAEAATVSSKRAKLAYHAYCTVLETELNALYDEVQSDFSTFYRELNEDDEQDFTAKFTPSEGSLDLTVNFYGRGLFPPGAYHSEGHQDGMGVCLYFALMKRLFAERFTFALLDDVVMSVDSGHRYQFCKLLKAHFPNTQFIITTHDRLWAEQMRSAGLVTSKTAIAFHSWTVDTGPLVESNEEIWKEIESSLARGKAEVAAHALRHHLEYVARHLADQLGASPQFRADGDYDLGELLPAVLQRARKLLGKAAETAQSWGKEDKKKEATELKSSLSSSAGASNVEQWAVNKAVHYNAWANFGKKDFEPVVAAFRELLGLFHCASCDSWIYLTPKRGPADALRCPCQSVNFNLKPKQQ